MSLDEIGRIAALLSGQSPTTMDAGKVLETGIKVIDVMCPLCAGGTVGIAAELGAGITVVAEEMVRRLSGGTDPISLFVLAPPPSPDHPTGAYGRRRPEEGGFQRRDRRLRANLLLALGG